MDTVDFLEKGSQYAKERYPDEYSDKADGRITHAFVDGAIYATVAAWKRIDPKEDKGLEKLRASFPVILLDTTSFQCAFAETNKTLDSLLYGDHNFTHYMPTEVPPDAFLEPEDSNAEAQASNKE